MEYYLFDNKKAVDEKQAKQLIDKIIEKCKIDKDKKIKEIPKIKNEIISLLDKDNLDSVKEKLQDYLDFQLYTKIYDSLKPNFEIIKKKYEYMMSSEKCPEDLKYPLHSILHITSLLEIEELNLFRDILKQKYGSYYLRELKYYNDKPTNEDLIDKKDIILELHKLSNERIGILTIHSFSIYSSNTLENIFNINVNELRESLKKNDKIYDEFYLKDFIELKNKNLILYSNKFIFHYKYEKGKYKLNNFEDELKKKEDNVNINILPNDRIGILQKDCLLIYSLNDFKKLYTIKNKIKVNKNEDKYCKNQNYYYTDFIELTNTNIIIFSQKIIQYYQLEKGQYKLYNSEDKNNIIAKHKLSNGRFGILTDNNSLIIYSLNNFEKIYTINIDKNYIQSNKIISKSKSEYGGEYNNLNNENFVDYNFKDFIESNNKDIIIWSAINILCYNLVNNRYQFYQCINEIDYIKWSSNRSYGMLGKYTYSYRELYSVNTFDNEFLIACNNKGINIYENIQNKYNLKLSCHDILDVKFSEKINSNEILLIQDHYYPGSGCTDAGSITYEISIFNMKKGNIEIIKKQNKRLFSFYERHSEQKYYNIKGDYLILEIKGKLYIYNMKKNMKFIMKTFLSGYENDYLYL